MKNLLVKKKILKKPVLKIFLGDKEDNKFSKAVNFMNQFNKVANVENLETENLENIVATKGNFKWRCYKSCKIYGT